METYRNLREAARKLSVDAWIDVCSNAAERPEALNGIPLPSMPSAEFQAVFVGSSGRHAIKEAALFYRYVLEANERFRKASIENLLDFGCGWGRYTRLFLRDVPEQGLYGVDPNETAIQSCRQHVPYASFINTTRRPPLPFRDSLFDIVIS